MADELTPAEKVKAARDRRTKARSTDAVIAAFTERISMLSDDTHKPRLVELLNELDRSLGRKTASEE